MLTAWSPIHETLAAEGSRLSTSPRFTLQRISLYSLSAVYTGMVSVKGFASDRHFGPVDEEYRIGRTAVALP